MQLIYLYIDKYKNIQNQGFNFSSDFDCSFDGKNLTVEKKKSFKSIFPDGINVTAIVGKNGSGKSSVYEVLHNLFIGLGMTHNGKNSSFVVLKQNSNYYSLSDKSSQVDLQIYENKIKKESTPLKNHKDLFTHTLLHGVKPLNKFYGGENLLTFLHSFSKEFQDIIKDNKEFFSFLNEKFIFTQYQFILNLSQRLQYDKDQANENLLSKLNYDKKNGYKNNDEIYKFVFKVIYLDLLENNTSKNYESNFESIVKKVSFDKRDLEELLLTLEDDIFTLKNIELLTSYEPRVSTKTHNSKIYMDYEILRSEVYDIKKQPISSMLDNKLLKYLYEKNILVCDFFHEENFEHNFLSLSTGEQFYIRYLTNIAYDLKQKIGFDKDIIIMLDEIEVSLHPSWQRKLFSNILKLFEKLEILNSVHVVLTTHSPFILSDIPKQNIIFLKDGKNVSDEVDIDTFGANIHTLLSHGFFMDDGLMGEYAKSKIDEVIKLLNNAGSLSDEQIEKCESIISIVGEPILKKQLQKMLEGKKLDYLSKDVKDEIAFLKHRIDILSKRR